MQSHHLPRLEFIGAEAMVVQKLVEDRYEPPLPPSLPPSLLPSSPLILPSTFLFHPPLPPSFSHGAPLIMPFFYRSLPFIFPPSLPPLLHQSNCGRYSIFTWRPLSSVSSLPPSLLSSVLCLTGNHTLFSHLAFVFTNIFPPSLPPSLPSSIRATAGNARFLRGSGRLPCLRGQDDDRAVQH